jgi:hypothetical protein
MPDKKIEDLLKQVMHKRNANKADEAVDKLGAMARRARGKNREAALDALRQAALNSPHSLARVGAYLEIGQSVKLEDEEFVAFLNEQLRDDDASAFCADGLARVKGKAAYGDLIEVITDPRYSMGTRAFVLDVLSQHSKRPFYEKALYVAEDDLTEDHFPSAELKAWLAAGFPEPEPMVVPVKDLRKLGITLPEDYAKFLLKHFGEEYEYDGEQWRLLTADGLLETVTVDDQDLPSVRQLAAFAKTLEDVMEDGETEDHKGKPYPLSRLAKGVAIGSSSDGGVLYLDPADDNAVWWFHPDGGDVERLSKTFKTWLKQAEQF